MAQTRRYVMSLRAKGVFVSRACSFLLLMPYCKDFATTADLSLKTCLNAHLAGDGDAETIARRHVMDSANGAEYATCMYLCA